MSWITLCNSVAASALPDFESRKIDKKIRQANESGLALF
jgi:hypothetical protein